MSFLRTFLVTISVCNLIIFLFGLGLGIMRDELLFVSIILTSIGFIGMTLTAVFWCFRTLKTSRFKKRDVHIDEEITPDATEAVMKNIRGIPFLIQAIQYSMETSYFRNVMNEIGDGVVQTSVIHTAPACTSVLDSESEPNTPITAHFSPRNSAEEQWLAQGEKWKNEQLRLSMERESAHLLVFPYCESSPHRDSMNMETLVHEFSRVDSINRTNSMSKQLAKNQFQVRCIGMSAEFIERFNNSFGANTHFG